MQANSFAERPEGATCATCVYAEAHDRDGTTRYTCRRASPTQEPSCCGELPADYWCGEHQLFARQRALAEGYALAEGTALGRAATTRRKALSFGRQHTRSAPRTHEVPAVRGRLPALSLSR